ncbi:hypothetical protein Dda_6860 [Drechslerella dactyloides]|uniref:SET domain-containing protein n=1 Tax=Drechslerella dactyloides TaxID=74499 RepID=A0AAD6NGK0_DREDA|nr:hypothetical protein Dda_6860 [Drechslerella dactyloides]
MKYCYIYTGYMPLGRHYRRAMTRTQPVQATAEADRPAASMGTSYARRDLYEERQTVEAGVGAFATAAIPSGTRIFCEESLVMMTEDATQIELYRAVASLEEGSRAAYWSLAASAKPGKDVSWIDALRQCCERDGESADSFNALVEACERAWSIFETNRFTCKASTSPTSLTTLGVFPAAARLNHSCAPNVFHRYNPLIQRLTVHALRDIAPGEELLTSYIDICHPTPARRSLLRHWGFKCNCTACTNPDVESDARRKKLGELFLRITNRERKRARSAGGWGPKDYEASIKLAMRTIRLLQKEGMAETDTLGVICLIGAQLASLAGGKWEEQAGEWARTAVAVDRKCVGEDSMEYLRAAEVLEATRPRPRL